VLVDHVTAQEASYNATLLVIIRGSHGREEANSFYYDGEIRDEDTVVDPDGETSVPEKDQIIKKHGQQWRVTFVMRQSGAGTEEYSVHKVYLARA